MAKEILNVLPSIKANRDGKLGKFESLHTMSSSSSSSLSSSASVSNAEEQKLRIIVKKILKKLPTIKITQSDAMDIDGIMGIIMPKVLYELKCHKKLQRIVKRLKSFTDHTTAIDHDIATIFLDLHKIYKKLEAMEDDKKKKTEQLDTELKQNQKLTLIPKEKPSKRSLKSKPNWTDLRIASHNLEKTISIELVPPPYSKKKSITCLNVESRKFANPKALNAERRTFMSNMMTLKKSKFSLNLNRGKIYYHYIRNFVPGEEAFKKTKEGKDEKSNKKLKTN